LIAAVFAVAAGTVQAGIATDLVQNGGFELNPVGNQPNTDTAGTISWYTDESATGQLITEAGRANSGSNNVIWQFYFANPTLIQDLTNTVQAGKSYELEFYHRLDNPSGNASHTNESSCTFSLYTAPAPGGPWVEAVSFAGIIDPTPGPADLNWTNFTATISAAELVGVLGEYMQIRIKKDNGSSTHRILVDDVAFGPSDVAVPALLATIPSDELALYVGDASAVVTGNVAVSYVEGDPPANVEITAISVVEQSHAGGFANATTLPLTLTAPAPSNDTVFIAFDTAAAGIVAGETATGVVEIVWNEVGSASSSTNKLAVNATFMEVNENNIIAIFDQNNAVANPRLGGLVAELSGYHGLNSNQGSTDGTYGTLFGNAPTDGGGVQGSLNNPVISMALTNWTGYDIVLDSLHYDAAKMWNKGPKTITVSISGDVTSASLFTNDVFLTQFSGTSGDYDDFDIDLTGLTDRTLAHGESALIQFSISDGDPSNSNAVCVIDNIALLGEGSNGAGLTRVPGGWISMAVSKLDLGASELVEMFYTEGDAATNVVITGITLADETHPGAFGYSNPFPVSLLTPEETNEIFTVLFDNTVADLPAGEWAYALYEIEWNEAGLPGRVFNLDVYAFNPTNVPTTTNVIALVDTEFLTADAAVRGVKAVVGGVGNLQYNERGSEDGTYGSISTNVLVAPVTTSKWQINNTNTVAELSFTNTTVANIELSSLHFDIGRWYANSADGFTLSVSGDVTANPSLLVSSLTILGFNNFDYDDHDIDLTGLADHTLAAGESVTFTITLDPKPEYPFNNTWIDNVALLGDFDAYGGWADEEGLTVANNLPGQNPDGDNLDNLAEFASGNDPLVADGPFAASWLADDGGTTWLYHVHSQRCDDPTLTYGDAGADDVLSTTTVWDTNDVDLVGASSSPGLWITVTNRTEATTATKFISVEVGKN
jgi:hypothetical protein